MSSLTDLKDRIDTKTLNMVLLTFATGGIYTILWLYRNYSIIDEITETKTINDTFVIWIAVCVGLGSLFGSSYDQALMIIGGILSIASTVLYIVCAFKMKTCLQNYVLNKFKMEFPMNGFYTFIFSIFYINYCINDLGKLESRQRVKSSEYENIAQQLEKLAELKEKGIINEEEFNSQKAKLLNGNV
ncbi:SHOCT domain-containing protein [Desulfonema magnum]|uniref:SHOCT domain-containing protein n=1 Tax=Desulfonema magnum TaxID=45655 RepID=A0A975GLW2_9BACT|nr:SHOCT domain-containing protein [Desulfonema magnum]QTA86187.1 Uncharacterized protein dnm_022080 [Desulfonema magnum]